MSAGSAAARAVLLLAALTLTSACAPRYAAPPNDPHARRAECRRARGRVIARAFGMTLGVAVVAVVVVAAAAGGSSGSVGGGGRGRTRRERRRADREYRRQVCSDLGRELPPRQYGAAVGPPPPGGLAPTEQQLAATMVQAEGPVRTCFGDRAGTVHLDAVIDGPSGQVAAYDAVEGLDRATRGCLDRAFDGVRFSPFAGSMRVRWAVQLSAPANTPLAP